MLVDIPISQNFIDFNPKSEAEEIIQNVRTICSTIKGTVPLDRNLGVNPIVIDAPVNTARAKISAHFIDAIREFEPRADVVRVAFRSSATDEVLPVVSIKVIA